MIRDYQAISKTWFLKGHQRIIPTTGKYRGVKLLGVLNYETGHVYCEDNEKYDAEIFLDFLKNILNIYPTGNIVMILDNARIHHAKLLQTLLGDTPRLKLVFLPPYSPKLNLIEAFWGWLKSDVINNTFYSTVEDIREAIQVFINDRNKHLLETVDRLCVTMYRYFYYIYRFIFLLFFALLLLLHTVFRVDIIRTTRYVYSNVHLFYKQH